MYVHVVRIIFETVIGNSLLLSAGKLLLEVLARLLYIALGDIAPAFIRIMLHNADVGASRKWSIGFFVENVMQSMKRSCGNEIPFNIKIYPK